MFPIQVLRRSDCWLNLQKKLIKLRRETDHPYQSSTDIGDCPTFTMSLSQMYVNIPYMEYLGRLCIYIYRVYENYKLYSGENLYTLGCLGYIGNHRLPSCNKASIKIPEWPPGSIIWELRRWIAIPEWHVTSSTKIAGLLFRDH